MKRSLPGTSPDPPSRRKRRLSEEERLLWESVAGQIKPLRKTRVGGAHGVPRAQGVPRAPRAAADVAPPEPSTVPSRQVSAAKENRVARPEPPAPPLAPIGRRERARLSRGRKEIDARLDLHGMTVTRAHRVLSDFLQRAHLGGLTFVLVITGKGDAAAHSGRGVLRRQVPQWLGLPEFRPLVVGFEQAHIGHGGEGALYVRIRRAR